jgi:hypothetical protein
MFLAGRVLTGQRIFVPEQVNNKTKNFFHAPPHILGSIQIINTITPIKASFF